MPTNKYDQQTTFIGTKNDFRRRPQLKVVSSGSNGNGHSFTSACRNLNKN